MLQKTCPQPLPSDPGTSNLQLQLSFSGSRRPDVRLINEVQSESTFEPTLLLSRYHATRLLQSVPITMQCDAISCIESKSSRNRASPSERADF